MMSPSIRGSSITSRLLRGGMSTSCSPGYCETQLSGAPRSTWPTSISKMVGSWYVPSLPLVYWIATLRSVVVDMHAYSTPPLHPNESFFQNALGSTIPERPRYTLRDSGSCHTLLSLMIALTTAWMVVV
jgi:hypothetical protein